MGEFAIGVNPYILKPMKDILFDEKIMGSIHLTPGNCYDEAPNGNASAIHWDLVLIQREEFGGGEILVRRSPDPEKRPLRNTGARVPEPGEADLEENRALFLEYLYGIIKVVPCR